ncbi:MAG: DUF2855 family protein [Actinomycetota bacterium]|nr:DUF2855 family protein [Actinomycetota bacterium]
MEFLIRRDDLHATRFEQDGADPEIADGQALLAVDSFGLTSNNITYAVFGDAMNYWEFFPAGDGWGRMPVWGFAEVAASKARGVDVGSRLYGYLPPSSHLVVRPDRANERGFTDASPHRAELPSAYQGYRRIEADPAYDAGRENEQILFWPLFYTSFLIDDFLADEGTFGADTVVLSSASSKTAIIAAYLLAQRGGIELIGLTSARNQQFVTELGIYDEVVGYDETDSLPREQAVYVDISGDAKVRREVHEHYGDRLAHSAAVGMTHWDKLAAGAGELTGPKPTFFFAPNRIRKRGADWGTAKLEENVAAAWHPFAEWSQRWLRVEPVSGDEQIEEAYLALLDGEIDPRVGHVVSL